MIGEHFFLLDNNVLTKMSPEDRASEVVSRTCRIPEEVLFEARGLPDIKELSTLVYATTAGVLEALKEVMTSVPLGETKLIDLYHNRGNADPVIVACALHAQRAPQTLFERRVLVVTDDQAVRDMAEKFQIEVFDSNTFRRLIAKHEPWT